MEERSSHIKRKMTLPLVGMNDVCSPCFNRNSVESPMSNLAHSLFSLSCAGGTPRRRLSLCESPASSRSSLSSDAGISLDSPVSVDATSESSSRKFFMNTRPSHARRLMRTTSEPPICSPAPLTPIFSMKKFFSENDDGDEIKDEIASSLKTDDKFTFAKPSAPSGKDHPFRSISAPANLFKDDEVKLKSCSLTNSEEEEDDGFLDFMDSESIEPNKAAPSGLDSLISMPIIKKCSPTTKIKVTPPGPLQTLDVNKIGNNTPVSIPATHGVRRSIFKVPSQGSLLKRNERPKDHPSPIQRKKLRCCSIDSSSSQKPRLPLQSNIPCRLERSQSMFSPTSKPNQADLLGDQSKPYCLPLVVGKHRDLKCISANTLAKLINNEFSDEIEEYFIVDCRYPYEYLGGHIKGAINKYRKTDITSFFLDKAPSKLTKRRVIVFHCEFSSKRGPDLSRYLRNKDRDIHHENYPALFYPELYLLEGGYKEFFHRQKELCEPQTYKEMLDKDNSHDLKHFRAKSKSWDGERSRLKNSRSKEN
ncbi:M-phase inducer phosphatase-like [Antedon mediterranea]|uniref:M-phase inducer phosphatase-like n=1 Tax=Antedon mediterranea TaxID=105859 RepID=UPI003AF8AF91